VTMELESEWKDRRIRTFPPPQQQTPWGGFLEQLYRQNAELRRTRNFFVKVHNGIGDQVSILGLLDSCRRYHGADRIVVLALDRSKELISFFPEAFDHSIFLSEFPNFEPATNGRIFDVLHMPSKAHILNGMMNPWFTKLCVPYLDQYRIGLSLPPDASYVYPAVPDTNIASDEVQTVAKLTSEAVVLFPHSNTWPGPSQRFWTRLAESISQSGIRVFTNVKNSVNQAGFQQRSRLSVHDPIPGTEPLSCSLSALLFSASLWRGWASGVSGPAFLLAGASRRGVVLHQARKITISEGVCVDLAALDSVSASFPTCSDILDYEVPDNSDENVLEAVRLSLTAS